jgi:hypothetical protein
MWTDGEASAHEVSRVVLLLLYLALTRADGDPS